MSAGAVLASAAVFHKRYPSAGAADVALRRSLAARGCGVLTPAVRGRDGPTVLCFDRVVAHGVPTLEEMVRVRAPLQAMPTDGLARFDPFLQIRPRLAGANPHIGPLMDDLRGRDAALNWPASEAAHCDFHPGQTIRDQEGTVWLIDLDDMALAPPEADLGNLAAWLATQAPADLHSRTTVVLNQVLWAAQFADPFLARHFCEIALVRRALKLREKGIGWVEDQLPLRA